MTAAELLARTCGWNSTFPQFTSADPYVIRGSLHSFVRDASPEQIRAWDDSIPFLQRETAEFVDNEVDATRFTAILEYRLPLEARRPDMVVLMEGPIIVVEIKGKSRATSADLDQVAAYARDLRCYHRECADRPVHAILVPTMANEVPRRIDDVIVVGPTGLDAVLHELHRSSEGKTALGLDPGKFLSVDAYCPLPTLVRAARELLESHSVRTIWRAQAATEPAVQEISRVSHAAHQSKTRRLVLVTGVPGAGKTLVGLRAVHAGYLDDLAVERTGGKPTAPAVYLSGNGPLVEVLQYQLKSAGGGGKTFVRGVKDYLDSHVPRPDRIPNEHMLVFDEAQRAFSSAMVAEKHRDWSETLHCSEPELFVKLVERIPEWSVLICLIGTGQEIHRGEEEGIGAWFQALSKSAQPDEWTVHCPGSYRRHATSLGLQCEVSDALSLNESLRFHLTAEIDKFVDGVLAGEAVAQTREIGARLHSPSPGYPGGMRFLVSRNIETAKCYLRDRYRDDPEARFGLVASSKDKILEKLWGIPNSFMATKNVKLGPWYGDGEESERSCRRLERAVTEFGAQGLELDMALLAWGTDFRRVRGAWNNSHASGYAGKSSVAVKDPMQLRRNAYRVLMTRGRDGTVVYVPQMPELDETYEYLIESGFRILNDDR